MSDNKKQRKNVETALSKGLIKFATKKDRELIVDECISLTNTSSVTIEDIVNGWHSSKFSTGPSATFKAFNMFLQNLRRTSTPLTTSSSVASSMTLPADASEKSKFVPYRYSQTDCHLFVTIVTFLLFLFFCFCFFFQ